MRRASLSWLAVWVAASSAGATTILVSPSDSYDKIESASAGDEVVIAPGRYAFRVYLTQAAPANAPIVIRAQDPSNPPVWDLSGMLVENAPGSYTAGDRGRGCWQLSGATNIKISGLVIQECHTASHNSAGLRYYNGSTGIELKDIVFRRNDNGLTGGTQESELTAEFCEFDSNGNLAAPAGSPTHNIYIYGGTFALRYSYAHDPIQGQNFHIRARQSTIEYNWFARPLSYAGDLMTDDDLSAAAQQTMLLRGNLIDQGNPQNHGQIFAIYNDSGLSGLSFSVTLVSNIFVVTQPQGIAVHLSNADGTTMTVRMDNNLISGGSPYLIENSANASAAGTNNWMPTGSNPLALSNTVFGTNPFKDAPARDFTLAPGSTAIGAASTSTASQPTLEYYRDESVSRMYRPRASANDIGAFESTTNSSPVGPYGGTQTDGGTPGPDGGNPPDAGNPDGGSSGNSAAAHGTGCTSTGAIADSLAILLVLLVFLTTRRTRLLP